MKSFIISAAVFITVGLSFTSCEKDKDATATKQVMMTSQPWVASAFTRKNLATGTVDDMYAPMTPCYRDDQHVFRTNGTFEGNAGAVKCSPSDPQVYQSGTWSFESGETVVKLIITTGASGLGTYNYKLQTLTATQLVMYIEDGGYGYTTTFGH